MCSWRFQSMESKASVLRRSRNMEAPCHADRVDDSTEMTARRGVTTPDRSVQYARAQVGAFAGGSGA